MEQLKKFFEDLFLKKIPWQLPVKAKEVIVKIAPWLAIIILIVSLPAVLAIFGLGTIMGGFAGYYGVHFGTRFFLGWIVMIVQLILIAMSISGLMKREMKGWNYIYYSSLVSAVYALISSYGIGSLIWSLLGTAIGLYLLFQVKSYYK